jgi:hypothetical protein
MLSDGLKSKTYSLRNETEEYIYNLKLKNGTMGEKMVSNLIWFNGFRGLHVSHHKRKDNINMNLRKQVANV